MIGNVAASGTEIIGRLGEEHEATGDEAGAVNPSQAPITVAARPISHSVFA